MHWLSSMLGMTACSCGRRHGRGGDGGREKERGVRVSDDVTETDRAAADRNTHLLVFLKVGALVHIAGVITVSKVDVAVLPLVKANAGRLFGAGHERRRLAILQRFDVALLHNLPVAAACVVHVQQRAQRHKHDFALGNLGRDLALWGGEGGERGGGTRELAAAWSRTRPVAARQPETYRLLPDGLRQARQRLLALAGHAINPADECRSHARFSHTPAPRSNLCKNRPPDATARLKRVGAVGVRAPRDKKLFDAVRRISKSPRGGPWGAWGPLCLGVLGRAAQDDAHPISLPSLLFSQPTVKGALFREVQDPLGSAVRDSRQGWLQNGCTYIKHADNRYEY